MSKPTHEAIRSREKVEYVRTEYADDVTNLPGWEPHRRYVTYRFRGKLWRCLEITWERDYTPIRGKQ